MAKKKDDNAMHTQHWEIMSKRHVKLSAYLWEKPDTTQISAYPSPRPAILICPGGGYTHVSYREAEPIAMRFYAAGYQAFVLTYSVGDDSCYPHPWVDASRALRFIRSHSSSWDIDSQRIAIAGFSAGGHVSAWLSACYEEKNLVEAERLEVEDAPFYEEEMASVAHVSNRPDACLLGYPVVDLRNRTLETYKNVTQEAIIQALGYVPGKIIMDQQDECSLPPYVSANHPPTFIWTTARDRIVPPEQSLSYAKELIGHGVTCELHVFPEGEHGLSTANYITCSDGRPVPERVEQWMPLALDFLGGIFHLS